MRIAIAAEGTRGDIYPMLALAERLTRGRATSCACALRPTSRPRPRRAPAPSSSRSARTYTVSCRRAPPRCTRAGFRSRGGSSPGGAASRAVPRVPEAAPGMDRLLAAGTILGGSVRGRGPRDPVPLRRLYAGACCPPRSTAPVLFPFQTRRPLVNRALWWSARRAARGDAAPASSNRARRGARARAGAGRLHHVLSPRPVLALDRPIASAPRGLPDTPSCRSRVCTRAAAHAAPREARALPRGRARARRSATDQAAIRTIRRLRPILARAHPPRNGRSRHGQAHRLPRLGHRLLRPLLRRLPLRDRLRRRLRRSRRRRSIRASPARSGSRSRSTWACSRCSRCSTPCMARPGFKRVWTQIVPEPAERPTYVLLSSLALVVLFAFWQPIGGTVWAVTSPAGGIALHAALLRGLGDAPLRDRADRPLRSVRPAPGVARLPRPALHVAPVRDAGPLRAHASSALRLVGDHLLGRRR